MAASKNRHPQRKMLGDLPPSFEGVTRLRRVYRPRRDFHLSQLLPPTACPIRFGVEVGLWKATLSYSGSPRMGGDIWQPAVSPQGPGTDGVGPRAGQAHHHAANQPGLSSALVSGSSVCSAGFMHEGEEGRKGEGETKIKGRTCRRSMG